MGQAGKVISCSVAVSLLVSSCGVVKQPPVVSPSVLSEALKKEKEVNFLDIKPFVVEHSLRSLPEDLGRKEVSPFRGSLKKFCSLYGLTCLLPKDYFVVVSKGDLKGALKEVERQINLYYDYLGGNTVRFVPYQTVVVRFPLISSGLLSLTYFGDDEDSKEIANKVEKSSFYSSLEEALKNFKIEVKGEYSYETSWSKEENSAREREREKSKNSSFSLDEKGKVQLNNLNAKGEQEGESFSSLNRRKNSDQKESGLKGSKSRSRKRKAGEVIYPVIETIKKGNKENSLEKGTTFSKNTQKQKSLETSKEKVNEQKRENSFSLKEQENKGSKRQAGEKADRITQEKWEFSYQIVKDAGIVSFVVSPSLEREVMRIVKSIARQYFSALVKVRVAVIVLNEEEAENLKTSLSLLKRAYRKELSVDTQNFQISFSSLSQNYLQGIASGVSFNSLLNYVVSSTRGKVVNTINLITLPRTLARIKDYTGIPYLQPQQVSVGGTNPQLTYDVLYVKNGMEMRLIPSVIGNSVYLSLSVLEEQYEGDKQVQAGTLGTFSIPIKSPKSINTSLFLKSGDILIIGGLRYNSYLKTKEVDLFMPQKQFSSSDKRIYFIIQPKLLKLNWGSDD